MIDNIEFKTIVSEEQLAMSNELRCLMSIGEVEFSYQKKDGTIRNAKGTLNMTEIPAEHIPTGDYTSNPLQFRYFDTEKQAWRSFKVENLISYGKSNSIKSAIV